MNKEALEKIEELEKQINELKESLKKPVKKKTPFDETNYHWSALSSIESSIERGKAFSSRILANRQDEKDKLIKELWEWWYLNDGVELDWNDLDIVKYAIEYSHCCNEWNYAGYSDYHYYFDRPYYSTNELAKRATEEFRDRLDILLTPIYEE